jgi:hypothetical protein
MKVGDTVRLIGKKKHAKIIALVKDIKGGVYLDRELENFRNWNVKDLALVQEGPLLKSRYSHGLTKEQRWDEQRRYIESRLWNEMRKLLVHTGGGPRILKGEHPDVRIAYGTPKEIRFLAE